MSNTAEKKIETKVAEEEGGGAAEADICCANCGIAGVDDIKLEECDGCDLVKYCADKCREDHREQHEEECKNRKAVLHDRKLFTQPDGTHEGECPICFLPLPLETEKSGFYTCCSETICKGCVYANFMANIHDNKMKARSCPFCREVADKEEEHKRLMTRIKANDPAALRQMGLKFHKEGDYGDALKYLTKAAEFGNVDAHYHLGNIYYEGRGVEKDEEKASLGEGSHWGSPPS